MEKNKVKYDKLYCFKCKHNVYRLKGDIFIRGSEVEDKCGECGTILRNFKILERKK